MKRIVPLIISALTLTALCACGKDVPESPADIKTDQVTSESTDAESTDAENTAAENPPSESTETSVKQLVITPADASVSPLELSDDELTDLFVNRIFANYAEWNNIADSGIALALDFNDEYDDGNDVTQYYLVMNIQDYAAFQKLTDAAMYGMISKTRYEITRMDDELLSIHFSASFSGSGSPQYVNDYEMTFDMKTGERVAPESLSD